MNAALRDEVVQRNVVGTGDDDMAELVHFVKFGCTVLQMPFEAYLQLKSRYEQHTLSWSVPCDVGGQIVWEPVRVWGLELAGELAVHFTCDEENPDVRGITQWLVDVSLGMQVDPLHLPIAPPDLKPAKHSEGSLTTGPASSTFAHSAG